MALRLSAGLALVMGVQHADVHGAFAFAFAGDAGVPPDMLARSNCVTSEVEEEMGVRTRTSWEAADAMMGCAC